MIALLLSFVLFRRTRGAYSVRSYPVSCIERHTPPHPYNAIIMIITMDYILHPPPPPPPPLHTIITSSHHIITSSLFHHIVTSSSQRYYIYPDPQRSFIINHPYQALSALPSSLRNHIVDVTIVIVSALCDHAGRYHRHASACIIITHNHSLRLSTTRGFNLCHHDHRAHDRHHHHHRHLASPSLPHELPVMSLAREIDDIRW